jgi:hypothetical protein
MADKNPEDPIRLHPERMVSATFGGRRSPPHPVSCTRTVLHTGRDCTSMAENAARAALPQKP